MHEPLGRDLSPGRWRICARLFANVVFPFLLAYVAWIGIRCYQSDAVVSELKKTAVSTARKILPVTPGSDGPTVATVADESARSLYPGPDQASERAFHAKLVRAVAYHLSNSEDYGGFTSHVGTLGTHSERESALGAYVDQRFHFIVRNLLLDTVVELAFIGALVLIFPLLAVAAVRRAKLRLAAGPGTGFLAHRSRERYEYQLRILTEAHFWHRFGFAMLVGFAATYMLAPTGVRAAMFESYIAVFGPPTEVSLPGWASAFDNAPPFVIGFAGYYLYALATCLTRHYSGGLSNAFFLSLFLRGVTVGVVGLALTAISSGDGVSNAITFLVGVFPQVGLKFLAQKANVERSGLLPGEATAFQGVPEIGLHKQAQLEECGVRDVHELASASVLDVARMSGIHPRLVFRAIDRAILIRTVGLPGVTKLEAIPLRTASDLVIYLLGETALERIDGPATVKALPGRGGPVPDDEERDRREALLRTVGGIHDVTPLLVTLAHDGNVQEILKCRLVYRDF